MLLFKKVLQINKTHNFVFPSKKNAKMFNYKINKQTIVNNKIIITNK